MGDHPSEKMETGTVRLGVRGNFFVKSKDPTRGKFFPFFPTLFPYNNMVQIEKKQKLISQYFYELNLLVSKSFEEVTAGQQLVAQRHLLNFRSNNGLSSQFRFQSKVLKRKTRGSQI